MVIEWPDKFPDSLPEDYVEVHIERIPGDETGRQITVSSIGEEYEPFVKELEKLVYLSH